MKTTLERQIECLRRGLKTKLRFEILRLEREYETRLAKLEAIEANGGDVDVVRLERELFGVSGPASPAPAAAPAAVTSNDAFVKLPRAIPSSGLTTIAPYNPEQPPERVVPNGAFAVGPPGTSIRGPGMKY